MISLVEYYSNLADKEMLALENAYLTDLLYGRTTEFVYTEAEKSDDGKEKKPGGLVGLIKNLIHSVVNFFKRIFGGGSDKNAQVNTTQYEKQLASLKEAADKGEKVKVMNFKAIDKAATEMCKYIDGSVQKFVYDLQNGLSLNTVSKFMKVFDKRLSEFDAAMDKYKDEKNYVSVSAREAYEWYKSNMSNNGAAGRLKECLDKIDDAADTMDRISRSAVNKSADVGINMYPENTRQVFQNAISHVKGTGVVVKHALSSIAAAATTLGGSVKAVKNGEGLEGVVNAAKTGGVAKKAVNNLMDATSKKEKYQLSIEDID